MSSKTGLRPRGRRIGAVFAALLQQTFLKKNRKNRDKRFCLLQRHVKFQDLESVHRYLERLRSFIKYECKKGKIERDVLSELIPDELGKELKKETIRKYIG